jgi:hypothetical protein
MDADKARPLIEAELQRQGFSAKEWREDPDDGLTAVIGRFEVVHDALEDSGIYLGDEGVLEASVVGAEEYHNVRVWLGFRADGLDSALEVDDMSALEPLDE